MEEDRRLALESALCCFAPLGIFTLYVLDYELGVGIIYKKRG